MTESLRTAVYATLLTLAIGWLLHVGKDILVPIVLSVLVVYVIDGLARLFTRVPTVGARLPEFIRYALSIALIALILTYVAQGLIAWAVMELFGLQFAPFWAVLIGLLNYVPYLGTVLSILFPVAFATMQFADLGMVLTLLAALSVAQFVIGFFLDPWLMGSSLNLSPFVILVSITVWGALWGIPGAFLAVPVTASLAMVFAEFTATRPVAVLLSRNGRLEPAPQRR